MSQATSQERPFATFLRVASQSDLNSKGRLVVKIEGRQIVLFESKDGIRATNNRCPHEGYPLAEGSLSDDCVLTCNWHNWKFDLKTGQTLVGGDRLRSYPVEVRHGEIFVDLADPPLQEQRSRAWEAFEESFRDHDYSRMAREIGRLRKAGVATSDVVASAFLWAHDRLEFGMTHAQAVAADWLALADRQPPNGDSLDDATTEETALVAILELVGHLAWDTLREDRYPYPEGTTPWDPDSFVLAIETEDEPAAIALVRGFLEQDRPYAELEHALARAALAHYQDYGHSTIYVYKTGQLVARLGPQPSLLFPLVRGLIFATREDQIPEFRGYAGALDDWRRTFPSTATPSAVRGPSDLTAPGPAAPLRGGDEDGISANPFYRVTVNQALSLCLAHDFRAPETAQALFDDLLDAAGWTMLHFDERWARRTDQPVSKNASWLDFTHALTFANAVHQLSRRYPDLWSPGLLQMGCFVGRLRGYIDPSMDTTAWPVSNRDSFLAETKKRLFDHGQAEYIISAHLVKVWVAVDEEVRARDSAPWVTNVLAAAHRFFEASHKRKHALRTVRQALSFVDSE